MEMRSLVTVRGLTFEVQYNKASFSRRQASFARNGPAISECRNRLKNKERRGPPRAPPISAKIRNQFVVFVCDGVRSGLRRFGSNCATPLAAAPLGAALRLPGGMQTETHATGCGFSVSGKE